MSDNNNTLTIEPNNDTTTGKTPVEKSSANSTNNIDLDKAVEKLSAQLKKELNERSILKINNRRITPVFATVAATLQAALLGYPVDKRAVFHRLLALKQNVYKML